MINLATLDVAIRSVGLPAVLGDLDKVERKGQDVAKHPATVRVTAAGAVQTVQALGQVQTTAQRAAIATRSVSTAAGTTTRLTGLEQVARAADHVETQAKQATAALAHLQVVAARPAVFTPGVRVGAVPAQPTPAPTPEAAGRTPAGGVGIGATLRGTLGALGITAGIASVARVYGSMTDATDALEASQRKLQATSKLTGVAMSEVQRVAAAAAEDFELSATAAADWTQQIIKLTGRAGDTAQAGAALTAWLDLAAAQGLDAATALQTLETTLIGQDEGLNRLGLANPQQIYEKWAAAAGTTAKKLTDAQKAQAIINEVVEAGTKVQGEYARRLDSAAGASERAARTAEQAAAAYGRMIEPVRRFGLEAVTRTLEWLRANRALVAGLVAGVGAILSVVAAWKAYTAIVAVAAAAGGPITIALGVLGLLVAGITAKWVEAKLAAADYFAFVKTASDEQLRVEQGRLFDEMRRLQEREQSLQAQIRQREALKEKPVGELTDEEKRIRGGGLKSVMELRNLREAARQTTAELGKVRAQFDAVVTQRGELNKLASETTPLPSADTGPATKEKDATDALIAALASLRAERQLTADEARLAATLEARLTTERDRLAAATNKTATEVIALAEAEERLARVRAVTSPSLGNVLAGRTPAPITETPAIPQQTIGVHVEPNAAGGLDAIARDGVRQFTDELERQQAGAEAAVSQFSADIGHTFGDTLAAAFFAAGAGESVGEAIKRALMGGLGAALQYFGQALITASGILKIALDAFKSLNPVGMAIAGVAMIALGGFLSGAASRAVSVGAGGGARASVPAFEDQSRTVTIPSRTPTTAGAVASPVAPVTSVRTGQSAVAAPAPRPITLNMLAVNPADPATKRLVYETMKNAERRGF